MKEKPDHKEQPGLNLKQQSKRKDNAKIQKFYFQKLNESKIQ